MSGLPQGNYRHRTLQFADTQETPDGYGLLWTVTCEDGSKYALHQAEDGAFHHPERVKARAASA